MYNNTMQHLWNVPYPATNERFVLERYSREPKTLRVFIIRSATYRSQDVRDSISWSAY